MRSVHVCGGGHLSDEAHVDLTCPWCDGDGTVSVGDDEWDDCPYCGGQAGWWDIAPEAREKIMADFEEWMGRA